MGGATTTKFSSVSSSSSEKKETRVFFVHQTRRRLPFFFFLLLINNNEGGRRKENEEDENRRKKNRSRLFCFALCLLILRFKNISVSKEGKKVSLSQKKSLFFLIFYIAPHKTRAQNAKHSPLSRSKIHIFDS